MPESEEGNPEDAIEWRDLGFGFVLAESGELLPESQLDNCLFLSTSEQGGSGADDECQEVE